MSSPSQDPRSVSRGLIIAVVALACAPNVEAQARPSADVQTAADNTEAAIAQADRARQLPRVEIRGNYLNAVGSSDAASQGTVTSKLEGRLCRRQMRN